MAIDANEQIEKFQVFFDEEYKHHINDSLIAGKKFLIVDFFDLSKYDHELAEELLDQPDETIKAAEIAIAQSDLNAQLRVRIKNLPESQKCFIRNLRSTHLDKFICIEGLIRQASDVRPKVVSARFECPSCNNVITILQTDQKFREPHRCSCGRNGHFKLLSKELIDAQRIVLEEMSHALDSSGNPRKLAVFIREDLVDPRMEKRTIPGTNVRITGVLGEIPIPTKDGGTSTTYDIVMNANYIELIDEDFSDIAIRPEDVEAIKKLAADKNIYTKLVNSIAPNIYGHELIKEAVALQLFGASKKMNPDNTSTRGDIHILLCGDPGAGKSQILTFVKSNAPKVRYVAGKSASGAGLCIAPDSLVVTNPGGIQTIKEIVEENLEVNENIYRDGIWNSNNPYSEKKIFTLDSNLKIKPKEINQLWRITPPEYMVRLKTRLGKELIVTPNTKLCTSDLSWREAAEFNLGDFIATTRNLSFPQGSARILTVALLKSNPVVLNAKPIVKSLIQEACKRHCCDKRKLAKLLGMSELSIYHNWVNENARGNIKLNNLKKLADCAGLPLENVIIDSMKFSLYNGHPITLPKYVNEELLYLAGLIAGDGDLHKGGHSIIIRFSNRSNALMQRFVDISSKLFSVNPKISSKASDKRPLSMAFGSNLVFEILESLGIPKSPKSHIIDMSNILLKIANEQLIYFLRGYFDTDGGCVERNLKDHYIESNSTSKIFSEKLKLVLLRYSIIAKIREREPSQNEKIKGKYPKYSISIRGKDNLELFRQFIGFEHPEKKQKLNRIIGRVSKSNTNIDIIPNARKLIKGIQEDLKVRGLLQGRRDANGISRKYLLNLLQKLNCYKHKNIDLLNKLASSDIFWDIIVKREIIKNNYPYVYDLTVEDSHNFIVNGVLVHNTATVVKDEFLRGWALEAGAIVLADRGLLAIDEMDKMSKEDTAALHQAMEQQVLTIAKANIQATLRCETAVLAAANPKFGRFDPYTTIASQIDMPPALINRFDLLFIVRDKPDKERDSKIAHMILQKSSMQGASSEIKSDLLRKYIAYAKQNVRPVLTKEALEEIKKFYVELRNNGQAGDEKVRPIPISARQLEAIVRLAEASARIRLSDKATVDDARRGINLLRTTLMDVGIDPETGQLDIDRIGGSMPASERGKIMGVRDIIFKMDESGKRTIPVTDIFAEAMKLGIPQNKVEEALEKLKRSGDIFMPKSGFIQRI